MTEELQPITKLTRDLRAAAQTLSPDEARYLVDAYYMMQENRIRSDAQIRALTESGEPHSVIDWLSANSTGIENGIKSALDRYSASHVVGQWARSQKGIGPVIAAGLLAHIDIHKAPTVGHIWNFAGLNPGVTWGKGEKRPWNAALKVLTWKMGESFVKVSGDDGAYYGALYKQRKLEEQARNDRGELAEQAAGVLEKKRIGKDTDAFKAYSVGRLPPAHIHARAKRWAVKIFLSHLHAVWHEVEFNRPAPEPYAIAHLGHAHLMKPPGWPMAEAAAA